MSSGKTRVEGEAEVVRALKKSGELDLEEAGTEAARNLLPFVEANTRYDTGRLAGGWMASEGGFVNEAEYAVYQEFGTVYVDPTNAIQRAADEHGEVLVEAFAKEAQDAGDKAGLGD